MRRRSAPGFHLLAGISENQGGHKVFVAVEIAKIS
jgi:hypothetical protein